MQRCAGGYPYLQAGFPQQGSLPGVQAEIRAAHSQCHPQGVHGRQEGLREDVGLSGIGAWILQVYLFIEFN